MVRPPGRARFSGTSKRPHRAGIPPEIVHFWSGGSGVVVAERTREAVADGVLDSAERHLSGERGERPEERHVGDRPSHVLPADLGGGDGRDVLGRQALRELGQAESVERRGGVEHQVSVRLEAREQGDLVEQGRVLHDEGVRVGDRLTQPDRLVVDPTERHDRRSCPF